MKLNIINLDQYFFLANFRLIKFFYNIIFLSSILWQEDFGLEKEIYLTFFLEENNFLIKIVIEYFEVIIENVIKHIYYIYYFCS